jgi:hypothetical protein
VHFMKMNFVAEQFQANGLAIGNKMHFMTAARKGDTKFGGYYPASSEGGVTNNGYFHRFT